MKNNELLLYKNLLADIKNRVRKAQHRAALTANAEMILMYWDIGRMISERQKKEGWGAGVIPRLAVDLKNELPEEKGFSETNLKRMVQFSLEYSNLFVNGAQPAPQLMSDLNKDDSYSDSDAIWQQPVPQLEMALPRINSIFNPFIQLPWGHNILLIQKIKDLPIRLWYAQQSIEQGWSRNVLKKQIEDNAYQRQGGAVTNFQNSLPEPHADIARGLLKDPYLFDFLTLEEPFHERELETGLISHIQKFLLELGRGFAFVGRQYIHKPIGVADYELSRVLPKEIASSLPSIEDIESELSESIQKN